MIDFIIIKHSLPLLLRGLTVSIKIAFLSSLIGFGVGIILGFILTEKNKLLRIFANTYVNIVRGTPMLLQIIFIYNLLPLLGIKMTALFSAILAIGFNSGAYVSQVIKSGILSVSKGQIEAAKVLGFSNFQIMRYIIFPNAFRVVLPALGNEFITLIKDSSLASTIGVVELFKEGSIIISRTYDAISVLVAVGFIYLILTSIMSFLIDKLEVKLNKHVKN